MTHYSEQPLHQQNRHPAVPWLSTTWSGFLTLSPNIHLRTTAGGIEVAQTLSNLSWKGGRQKLSGVSFQHLNPVFLLQEMGIKDKQIGKETNSKKCLSLSFAQSEALLAFAKLLLQSCSWIPGWKMSPAILGKTAEQLASKSWTGGRFQLEAAAPVVCSHPTLMSASCVWKQCVMGLPHQLHLFCSLNSCNSGGKKGLGLKGDTRP